MRPHILLLFLLLIGCTSLPTSQERQQRANQLAIAHGWVAVDLHTSTFDLRAYVPRQFTSARQLTIYIEGDGLAWKTQNLPSNDPTPNNPQGLKLALAHPRGSAVYLARPCQYGKDNNRGCDQKYWTQARFAPEVIRSMNQAIDQLKVRFGAERLTLVGYSGGGAIAALVAAGRADVDRLITVAGNLDHRGWTQLHRLTPLSGSLNPVDVIPRLSRIKQWHFVGGKDKVIPAQLVEGFADQFPVVSRPRVLIEPDFDHHCCWVQHWPRLVEGTIYH